MNKTQRHIPLPTLRETLSLVIPQLGLMLCHLTISLTDIGVATRINADVVASLGLVGQVFTVLMLITSVVSSGCMVTIAKAVGARKILRAKRYAFLTLGLASSVGTVTAVLGLIALPFFLYLLAPSESVAVILRTFIIAYCCHIPFFYSMVIMNSIFRAHKLVWFPFATLICVMLVNAVGSIGFGLGYWGLPQYGAAGVAWSTFASGLVGAASNFAFLWYHDLLGTCPPWRWVRIGWLRLLRIGGPATLGQISSQAGSFVVMTLLVGLPLSAGQSSVAAVAGMTLGSRAMGVLQFPFAALSMALTISCGHMLGAKNAEGCMLLGRKYCLYTALFMVVGAGVLFFFQEHLLQVFAGQKPNLHNVFEQARIFLLFACILAPLQVISQMQIAVFTGAGATYISCISSCMSMWLVTVPVAYVLSYVYALGAVGIYTGMAVGTVVSFMYTTWQFFRGQWLAREQALC